MNLNQIETNLRARHNTTDSINDLGTILRDEESRKLSIVSEIMPLVLGELEQCPAEVLRVLINFTAYNDDNREWLTGRGEAITNLWHCVNDYLLQAGLELSERSMILLTQFVRSTEDDKMTVFLSGLHERGIDLNVFEYYKSALVEEDTDAMLMAVEFQSEMTRLVLGSLTGSKALVLIRGFEVAVKADDEDRDDILLYHALILYNVTAQENENLGLSGSDFLAPVYSITKTVPSDLKSVAHIKRKLFSACGNFSSQTGYDNFEDARLNINTLLKENDGYVKAAAAIALGNCVSSKETQQRLLSLIEEVGPLNEVVAAVLAGPFGDIVQIQAFHFLNNIMTREVADAVLEHYPHVLRSTKAVVDNFKYYGEVGQLYLKFLRKLISNSDRDLRNYEEMWLYLENIEGGGAADVQLLLLQKISSVQNAFLEPLQSLLLKMLLSTDGAIDASLLLQKLNTLAVFTQNSGEGNLASIVPELRDFLSQLHQNLESHSETAINAPSAYAALKNNSKFVAATLLSVIDKLPAEPGQIAELRGVCEQIVVLV